MLKQLLLPDGVQPSTVCQKHQSPSCAAVYDEAATRATIRVSAADFGDPLPAVAAAVVVLGTACQQRRRLGVLF